MRIDAHHHLWRYTAPEFDWISDAMSSLRRDFLPAELYDALASASVDGTVAVQARQTIEETVWLLDIAAQTPAVLGVVGWLPIASPGLLRHLDALSHSPHLKGLRHVVQAERAGFLDDPAFNSGIGQLRATGLVYDILIHAGQIEEAIRFVDRHPAQSFVLDHIAKPHISAAELEPWATHIRALALRPNVTCKLSGMVTEADFTRWSPSQLRPYFDVVLQAFTPSRLMIGTDWPVLTVGCTYARWWQTVEQWIAPLTADEQAAILGDTAARIYNLAGPATGPIGVTA